MTTASAMPQLLCMAEGMASSLPVQVTQYHQLILCSIYLMNFKFHFEVYMHVYELEFL